MSGRRITLTRAAGRVLLGLALLMPLAGPLAAAPQISHTLTHYDISGNSLAALIDEMARKGPRGHWAYTTWHIRWTGDCKVSLKIAIEMPRLRGEKRLTPRDRQIVAKAFTALRAHEESHAEFGRRAAAEILAARCKGASDVIAKWVRIEKDYDRRTSNGRTEGVTFDPR